jgi:hydrophobic/amphiphilic exporter-1 (mainly G- bacteria), HAE1 family
MPRRMTLAGTAARRPLGVTLLALSIACLGILSLSRLPVELLPPVRHPRMAIVTSFPEASVFEVETEVTERIENQVASLPGLVRLSSVSRDGVSLVRLVFTWGTDPDRVLLQLRERLDQVHPGLPSGVGRPRIVRLDAGAEPFMVLAVTGPDPETTGRLAESSVRRRLEGLTGVAEAELQGGAVPRIEVEISSETLLAHGLTLPVVDRALAAAQGGRTAGSLREGGVRMPLRTVGTLEGEGVKALEDVVVGAGSLGGGPGRSLRLGEVARIRAEAGEGDFRTRIGGRPSVTLLLRRAPEVGLLEVSRAVEQLLAELRAEHPELSIEVTASQAEFVRGALRRMVLALVLGGLLAFLVLFAFLKNLRDPLLVGVVLPLSVLGTLPILEAAGVSLNLLSLGGMVLGVGMLTDNAIVVLENMARHRAPGGVRGCRDAAVRGTEEVAGAITASTLSTVAVFVPLLFVGGVMGELLQDLALAVTASLGVSLALSLLLLPALRGGGWGAGEGWSEPPAAPGRVRRLHGWVLEWALTHPNRILIAVGGVGMMAILTLLTLDRDLLPRVETRGLVLRIQLPEGTPIEATDAHVRALEAWLDQDPGVQTVHAMVGWEPRALARGEVSGGPHEAHIRIRLRAGHSRELFGERLGGWTVTQPLVLQSALRVETTEGDALWGALGTGAADLQIRVRGGALEEARAFAVRLRRELEPALAGRVGGLRVTMGEEARRGLELWVRPEAGARHGVEGWEVADQVERALKGTEVTQLARGSTSVPVVVGLLEEERRSVRTLKRLFVRGIPLRHLVQVESVSLPAEIHREGGRRAISIEGRVEKGGVARAAAEVESRLREVVLPPGIQLEVQGVESERRQAFLELGLALLASVVLVYLVLAARFESLLVPIPILGAIPLALMGAGPVLLLTGSGLHIFSLLGIVLLLGIVVNDAIVKVDFIEQARARGATEREALREAGQVRLRPILMTSMTTVLGLLPMAIGWGEGSEMAAPLALPILGGLLTGTTLTLFVVPVLHERLDTLRGRLR